MTKEAVASWLMEHSSVPSTVLKPVAARLGLSTNYLGAALFAGQIVYENQDTIVKYANKGGVTVGEFLHQRSRERYGDDHPLTEHLGENVEALNEAFEGTEEEALTFAEFYRQYRAIDRDHRLTEEFELGLREATNEKMPDISGNPVSNLRGSDLPDLRGSTVPNLRESPLPGLRRGTDSDDDDVVEIPVTDAK